MNAICENLHTNTAYPVHELIAARWSPRAFSTRAIPAEAVHSMLEAARWAASSMNEQPWRFVLVTRDDEEGFSRALEALAPANRDWAQRAPLLLFTAVARNFSRSGKPNAWARHDLGLAMGNLSLQAQALGIAVHQMGGFDAETARRAFAIPEEFDIVTAVAIGYADSPDILPEPLRQRELAPRRRRPLSETVFAGRWLTPLPGLEGEPGDTTVSKRD